MTRGPEQDVPEIDEDPTDCDCSHDVTIALSHGELQLQRERMESSILRERLDKTRFEWGMYALWPIGLTIFLCVSVTQISSCNVRQVHDNETTRQMQLRANQTWAQARARYFEAYTACLHEGHVGRTCEDILGSNAP